MRFRKIFLLFLSVVLSHSTFAKKIFHRVKANESLMQISNQYYGTHQCWQAILSFNPKIQSKDSIEVNQRIEIPAKSSCSNAKISKVLSKKVRTKQESNYAQSEQHLIHDGFIVYNAEGKKERKHLSGPKQKYQFQETKARPSKAKKRKKKNKKRIVSNANSYLLQLASYPTKAEAMSNKKSLDAQGVETFLFQKIIKKKSWFRIQAGPFKSKKAAKQYFKNNDLKNFTKEYLIINANLN